MGIIRELDKKPSIHSYIIYTIDTWFKSTYIVYKSTILLLQDKYAVTILLISLFQFLLLHSRPMTLYYVMHHVTMVTCLFFVQEIKETEKKKKKKKKKKNQRK